MESNSNKWLYTALVLLLGILLIALFYLLRDSSIAPLLGLLGVLTCLSSILVYNNFDGSFNSKAQLLEKEIAFKYQLDDTIVANDMSGIVGISNDKQLLYLFSRLDVVTGIDEDLIKNQFQIDAFSFNAVKQLNVVENDITIVKSNVSELVGKSVKGGFGNTGIDNKKSIQKIRLQVVTDDVLSPTSDVFLFNSGYGLKVGTEDYNKFHAEIDKIFNSLKLKKFQRA